MTFDLQSLFPDLEALTPDGRWNMLQDWLAKNPEYQGRAERWSTQPIDEVFDEILNIAAKKQSIPVIAIKAILGAALQQKLKSLIQTLQTCYRERAGEQEKENVTTRKTAKRRNPRNPRRTIARTRSNRDS